MCFFVALGLIAPRLVLLGLWFFRETWVAVLDPWWLGLLGWLFFPFTSLAYVLINAQAGQVDGLAHTIILLIALFMDLGVLGGSKKRKKD